MKKIGAMFCLALFALLICGVDTPAQIKLTHGDNDIVVNISNQSDIDLESIVLEVDHHKLPEGFNATIDLQQINISTGLKSNSGLLLNISVNDNVKSGNYSIPVTLKDNANHSWDFSLDAEVELVAPLNFALHQNVPNPFNPDTNIRYEVACKEDQRTRLVIYNALGKEVRTLVDQKQSAGTYTVSWNGRDRNGSLAPSGVYFYRITSGSFTQMNKMLLLK